MAAPEWTSPAFLPGHRGLVDPAEGSIGRLSWGLDVQVALLSGVLDGLASLPIKLLPFPVTE